MVCNSTTRRLEWEDGTSVTYIPNGSAAIDFDCISTKNTTVSQVKYGNWTVIETDKSRVDTILCAKAESEEQCGGYTLMTGLSENMKPCLKIFTDPLPWELAQRQCSADFGSLITINNAEENKYFWRTAITNNLLEGMHIGAHKSSSDPSIWTWVDGEVPFNGKSYDNFVSSFPIPGAGECASMLTESASALWINEDCNDDKLPFICRRDDFSTMPKSCPTEAPKAEEDIFSPGFPNPGLPCEYVLFVAAKKIVEIEILTLISDLNRDFFEIFEGSSGSNLLANFTGSILAPTKIRTAKSNVMRVNWQTDGMGSNRGFRIRFHEASP
ncbi:hypothetical protein PENTCL1PPCAC_20177 [Pristionchus entomophagus]|uniref:CUB domain-containing protein n=1 Tax=Pristionchus entomophagus TaxID=358040 RepID=A0AAV5TUU1_9BILA|nr:hypothetical protein PENTCL1PPCAC_20177 [Pristionchus entomophagus]